MTPIEVFLLLLVAGICGAVARVIAGSPRGGCLVSIGVGFVGAFVGTEIARALALPPGYVISVGGGDFPLVWSVLGGALFVGVITLLSGRGGRDRQAG